jgi:hypothetical protein
VDSPRRGVTPEPDRWPPDWRTAEADALEAKVIRLGVVLAELDELEQVLGNDDGVCAGARALAARVRSRRNEFRDLAQEYRHAEKELA